MIRLLSILKEIIEDHNDYYFDIANTTNIPTFAQYIIKIFDSSNNENIGILELNIDKTYKKGEVNRVNVWDKYKNKGYGTLLFMKAKELTEKEKSILYPSSFQTDAGRNIWKSLEKRGLTQKDTKGRIHL